MHRIVWTQQAIIDLDRLEAFLFDSNPAAAWRAFDAIRQHVGEPVAFPERGRPARAIP